MADQNLEKLLLQEFRRLTQSLPASRGADDRFVSSALSARQVNQSYTQPLPQTAQPAPSAGASVAGDIGRTALKVFTSGFGLMPLVSGLVGLFGGGGSAPPPPLVPYAMPRRIQVTAANSSAGGAFQLAGYSQDGTPRVVTETAGGVNPALGQDAAPQWPATAPNAAAGAAPGASSPSSPQIVVNVQAMDSQSFLDRSRDIAQAVREAMLNMHALNDVVSEL
jgi:hypothetical protein